MKGNTKSLGRALLLKVVESFQRQEPKGYLGRTALQKLCYFLRVVGVPLPYQYRLCHYGPFSDSLALEVNLLEADDLLKDGSREPQKYSNYQLTAEGGRFLKENAGGIGRDHVRLIDAVTAVFGRLEPAEHELLATTHYAHGEIKERMRRVPTRREAIARVLEIKGRKFKQQQIGVAYDALKKIGLLGN